MTQYRRLSDKLVEAHTIACAEEKGDVAEILLRALEGELEELGKYDGEHRRSMEMQEEAFVRHRKAFPESHL